MYAFALSINKRIYQRHDNLERMYKKGYQTAQRHIDASIINDVSVHKDMVEKDIERQVDHLGNLILQNQISLSTIGY